jgi:hypothetical protein
MSREVISSILKVEFRAYEKNCKEYFEDATVEQALNYIWKHICHTAEMKSVVEYYTDPENYPRVHYGFKKKLTDEELQKLLKH